MTDAVWSVSWRVVVDGQDMTAPMSPYLIDIAVDDKDGAASDSCRLTLDDRAGQIRLPKGGASVVVWLQGVSVFTGVVERVRSSGSRGGGRLLTVSAKGFDTAGKAKEPLRLHKDDASLKEFLESAAEAAGFTIEVDPAFAGLARDYWAADGESLIHLGQRLARELYGTFKLRGTKAVLAQRGADKGLPTITGTVGGVEPGNVINWDIEPVTGRRKFQRGRVRYFDRKAAKFQDEEVEFDGIDGADAANVVRTPAADRDQAKAIGEGRKAETQREAGSGFVEIDLEPAAQAEGLFVLTGAREGVDGTYRIVGVSHRADRGGGSTTRLELKQPQGGAGKDGRPEEASPTGASGATGTAPGDAATGATGGAGGGGLPTTDLPGDGPE
ncbi:late control D family protein [Afifella sp. H1R]|uniref:phage late control D family protein n=1 Tax=Afifella sp. H1R TaxID=2908841 RepID=UPI001F270086|nr:late control D family protein [Afifella sp. H1R]MCF1502892.1 late control D family protein [Afifella sp. H1R]